MCMTEPSLEDPPRKLISQAPLNLLFNPSILNKKDVWDVDISILLELLLTLINKSEKKDLRLCGLALLTSSIIYRLKVESIFNLEKIAMQKKEVLQNYEAQTPIPELNGLQIPYRHESMYPVSVEDLLTVLENLLQEIDNSRLKNKDMRLEPLESFVNFNDYLLKFEEQLEAYEKSIMSLLCASGKNISFYEIISSKESIEAIRYFIALLYLATKGKVLLEQSDGFIHDGDIKISAIPS
jgi:segregation and condensation protein A